MQQIKYVVTKINLLVYFVCLCSFFFFLFCYYLWPVTFSNGEEGEKTLLLAARCEMGWV